MNRNTLTISRCAVPHAPGFTMLEVVVALLLVGLLAGTVTLSLAGVEQRAQLDDAVSAFVQFDHLGREHARRSGQTFDWLFQVKTDKVQRVNRQTQQMLGTPLRLPAGYRIEQLQTADQRVLEGQISIPCSAEGRSLSYAVLLSSARGQKTWLLIAGLTGQVSENIDEAFVQAALQSLQSSRHDID